MICLNSAAAAEELDLRVLGVGESDEVIVPACTHTATASAAKYCGARPCPAKYSADSFVK